MLDQNYWNNRYLANKIGWDVGFCTPPIARIATLFNPDFKVLIPGCGNAYEALYFKEKGFKTIHCLDFAINPIAKLMGLVPNDLNIIPILGDFFTHDGAYDLIVEQTFFCALDPSFRNKYVDKMFELLKPGGILTGVLFNCSFPEGPPFGGSEFEYRNLFKTKFNIISMESEKNSILPRKGNELFFILQKI